MEERNQSIRKMKKYCFLKTNEFFKRFVKNSRFFTERTIFWNKLFSFFLLIKRFFEIFFEKNSSFFWTNDFIERSFSKKTNETDVKWLIILRKNEFCFNKQTKWVVHEQWTNEMKKSNMPVSTLQQVYFMYILHFEHAK